MPLISPFGSLTALVGIVQNYCPVSKSDNENDIRKTSQHSHQVSEIGVRNQKQCYLYMTSATRHRNPEESKVLSRFRPYLIEGSNLRVILMCSPNAERSVLIPGTQGNRITITLRGFSYSASPIQLTWRQMNVDRKNLSNLQRCSDLQ